MTEHKGILELVPPGKEAVLSKYHALRKRMLFDPIGRPYDRNHPDETRDGNHRRVLLLDGEVIGTVRIDIAIPNAAIRLVTIREDLQGMGYGRILVRLSESFALSLGCRQVMVNAGDRSAGFWEKCGYERLSTGRRISMRKKLQADQSR